MLDSGGDLRVQLFGGPRLWKGDEEIPLSPFQSCLLAVVATEPSRSVTRERLAWLLWETEDDAKARHRISQLIYAINRKVGETLLGGDRDVVRVEANLQAHGTGATITADPLQELVGKEPTAAYERWMTSRSITIARRLIAERARLLAAAEGRHDYDEVTLQCRSILCLEPRNERCLRSLIHATALGKSPLEAFATFEFHAHQIRRKYPSWSPSQDTLELLEQVDGLAAGRKLDHPTSSFKTFVGRKKELERLDVWLSSVGDGWRSVLITGEEGVGKTRTLLELERLTRLRGHDPIVLSCYEGSSRIAFGLIGEFLSRKLILDLIAEVPQEIRTRLTNLLSLSPPSNALTQSWDAQRLSWLMMDTLAKIFHNITYPLFVLIDDIDRADSSSLEALSYLRHSTAAPISLIATCRFHRFLPVGASRLITAKDLTIDLQPLSRSALTELLKTEVINPSPKILDKVSRLSGGNPLFAIEVAHALEGGELTTIPESLDTLLRRRSTALDPNTHTILQFLAVQGKPANLELLSELTGFGLGEVLSAGRQATEHRLAILEADGLKFRHEIVRRWAYNSLGEDQRIAIHRATAKALSKGHAKTRPADIAWHYSEAGDKRDAYTWALKGAGAARSRGAFTEVIQALEIARTNVESEREKVPVLKDLGTLLLRHGELEAASRILEAAVRLSPPNDHKNRFSLRLSEVMARAQGGQLHPLLAAEKLKKIQSQADSEGLRSLALQAIDAQMIVLTSALEVERAQRLFDSFLLESTSASEPEEACRNQLIRCFAISYGEPALAVSAARKSLELATHHKLYHLSPPALTRLGIVLNWQAELNDDEIAELLDRARTSYHHVGDLKNLCNAYLNLATWWIDTSQLSRAAHCLETASKHVKRLRDRRLKAGYHANVGELRLLQGRYGEAERHFTLVERFVPTMCRDGVEIANAGLAVCAWQKGKIGDARRRAEGAIDLEGLLARPTFDPTLPAKSQAKRLKAVGRTREALAGVKELRIALADRHRTAWVRLMLLEAQLRRAVGDAAFSEISARGQEFCARLNLRNLGLKFDALG